jgi:periplasmic divalent cation tolerance protein
MTSIYEWEGKIQRGTEVALIAKTRSANLDVVIDHIKKDHSYECPCIVSWPIAKGYQPFLAWVTSKSQRIG